MQEPIARCMTERVVDVFEAVEIEEDDADEPAVRLCRRNGLADVTVELPAVG